MYPHIYLTIYRLENERREERLRRVPAPVAEPHEYRRLARRLHLVASR